MDSICTGNPLNKLFIAGVTFFVGLWYNNHGLAYYTAI